MTTTTYKSPEMKKAQRSESQIERTLRFMAYVYGFCKDAYLPLSMKAVQERIGAPRDIHQACMSLGYLKQIGAGPIVRYRWSGEIPTEELAIKTINALYRMNQVKKKNKSFLNKYEKAIHGRHLIPIRDYVATPPPLEKTVPDGRSLGNNRGHYGVRPTTISKYLKVFEHLETSPIKTLDSLVKSFNIRNDFPGFLKGKNIILRGDSGYILNTSTLWNKTEVITEFLKFVAAKNEKYKTLSQTEITPTEVEPDIQQAPQRQPQPQTEQTLIKELVSKFVQKGMYKEANELADKIIA